MTDRSIILGSVCLDDYVAYPNRSDNITEIEKYGR